MHMTAHTEYMASNLCGHSDAVSGLCSAHKATDGAGSDAHRGARPVSAIDLRHQAHQLY